MNSLLRQMEEKGRALLARKIPTWAKCEGIIPGTPISLEQCSSEDTARLKATLVHGKRLVDLTGGYGVDCYFMSR